MAEGEAAAVPSLPRDAVSEILSWAPVKSLCRFRCASKEWRALISDLAFVAQHKSRAVPEQLLVTSYWSGILVMDTQGTIVREIKGLGTQPTFASSLDHLICIRCSGQLTRVVDVATGTVLVASQIPSSKKPNGNLSNYVIRLGRAAVSGSYKAVRIVDFRRAYGVQPPQICEALTIGRYPATWRRVQPPPASVRILDFSQDWAGATVDGVVYFLCIGSSCGWDCVLGFDVESEEWRKTIDGPIELSSWTTHKHTRIAELNKSLCMIQTGVRKTGDESSTGIRCNIWLLTDRDNSTWVKAYSIPTDYSCSEFIDPLRVMPDDGVKLLFYDSAFTFSEPRVLRVYDPRDGTHTIVMKMPNNTFGRIGICSRHLEPFVAPPPKYHSQRC